MVTVQQVLHEKEPGVWSIGPDATVYEAVALMAEKGIGALPVVDWSDRLVGIISERDYTRKIVLNNRQSRETRVREIMTDRVINVGLDDTIDDCMVLMSQNHIRHLPVVDGDKLVGMLSTKDVFRIMIAEKDTLIEQLEHYITGTG